ncbi:uncharacterized protein A1O9_09857 [Exophiala aquamarina CBS 119918]|uniref:Major facilitator superfamily (MFS) profile domain-containing protein n=1 Tax=Exophiala aquamarina CBS 119918 TaxID=1182545 RepID=A0A072P2Y5_9EURO|nr:uncharacterized protein A1O9_09857 [Exophiala aquamarina CBS 119918]KEF54062.1 hypothetical protein A1O9_09857 [Exophiala aquamarina CBS 119918]
MTTRRGSVAVERNASIRAHSYSVAAQVAEQESWIEKKLKPEGVSARYPFKGKPLLYATYAFGSLGDALFGYNSGYRYYVRLTRQSGVRVLVLPRLRGADGKTASINSSIIGISVACLQLTAALGVLIAGRLGDIIGRKKCVRIGGFIYFFSAFIQMFAPDFVTFVTGRTIQGLGVGFLSMTVPIVQTEIATAHRRGLMVKIKYTCLIAGYMLSCWVDYGFNFLLPSEISWKEPFIIQIILSFILFAMSFYLPETPRWLAKSGYMTEYLQTVADLHSNGDTQVEHVQQVYLEIQEAVIYETALGKSTWTEIFTRYRKRTMVGITVQMFAQLNGINIISFYLPSTLAAAGFD